MIPGFARWQGPSSQHHDCLLLLYYHVRKNDLEAMNGTLPSDLTAEERTVIARPGTFLTYLAFPVLGKHLQRPRINPADRYSGCPGGEPYRPIRVNEPRDVRRLSISEFPPS